MIAATLVAPSIASAATSVRYDSTPAKGVVSVPSIGPEAYSFNEVGNEVIVPHSDAIKHVSVTMVSWACQIGQWNAGCLTTPGAKFQVPITLNLYAFSKRNSTTGVVTPGKRIASITKTFGIRYRPSAASESQSQYIGRDGKPHNGIAQTIAWPITKKLPADVVWTVSFNTATSGPSPLGAASPTDSLNVGLSPKVRVGHDRYPASIFWDTRKAEFAGGESFVTGKLNLDGQAWARFVPAARFSTH
jgi:hypothetical protein